MIRLDIVVAVPRLYVAVIALHEAHAALDEPARDQQLAALDVFAVSLANRCGLAAGVERLGRLHLHAVRQLKGLNSRFEGGILGARLLMSAIQHCKKIELPALIGARNRTI